MVGLRPAVSSSLESAAVNSSREPAAAVNGSNSRTLEAGVKFQADWALKLATLCSMVCGVKGDATTSVQLKEVAGGLDTGYSCGGRVGMLEGFYKEPGELEGDEIWSLKPNIVKCWRCWPKQGAWKKKRGFVIWLRSIFQNVVKLDPLHQ